MVNGDIDDPFEEELPSQPFEQPFLSMEVDNPESSTSPNDLFSSLVSISTNGNSNTGGQGKDLYKCHRCGKHFGRLDHVKRHCRSRRFLLCADVVEWLLILFRCKRPDIFLQAVLEKLQPKVSRS